MSQPSQATPKPAAQVSTGKPAEFEKASSGSAMATKPGVVTTATGGATGSGVTTGGSAAVGTAKAKPETAPASQVKSTAAVSSAAGTAAAAAAGTAATTAVAKAKESPKGTTKVQVEVPAATVTGVKETLKSVAPEKPAAGKATDVKPKTSQGGSMSLDALSSLGDLLPTDAPKPKAPEVRPEDIVSEGKHKKEKGVLVGEREDTLPPDYRFNREALEKLPAPKPEPTMGTGEALDILSGDFMTMTAGPAVHAPVVTPSAPAPDYSFKREELEKLPASKPEKAAAPPAEKKPKMETVPGDFSLSGAISSVSATTLKSVAPEAQTAKIEKTAAGKEKADGKPKASQPDAMSLDALSSLGDLLPTDAPKPEAPEVRPEDIVSEGKHKKEEGVLVGERDDTLPPDYRFNREALEKLPAPKPEPTIGTGEALDFLSDALTTPLATSVVDAPVVLPTIPPCEVTVEDVSAMSVPSGNVISSSTASGVHAPAPPSTRRTPAKPDAAPVKPKDTKPKTDKASLDTALDALAGDFIPSTAASAVSSAPCEPDLQLPAAADNALDALSDTLADIKPAPQPVPVLTKDVVKEKKIVEERLIKMGERDDTLPPEFRPTEEDLKKMEEEKAKAAAKPKEKGMDDTTALDLLSSDFSDAPKPAAPAVTSSAATAKLQPPVLDSEPLKPMAGPVLDSLADTLLPDKSKTDKAKKHHAEDPSAPDQLSAQQSSDVVPASTKKGGKR